MSAEIITDPKYFDANEAPYLSDEKTAVVIVRRRVDIPRAEYIYMRRFIIWRIAQHNEYREIWDFLSTVYPTENTFEKIEEDIKNFSAAAADLERIRESLAERRDATKPKLHLLAECRKIYEKIRGGREVDLDPLCALYRNWFGIPPRRVFDKTVAMYDKKFCEKYAPIFKFDLRTITSGDTPIYLQKDCDLPPIVKLSQCTYYYNTCPLSELESDLHLIFPRITPNYLYFELNPNITKEFILKHMDCECWRQWDLNILAQNPAFRWRDFAFIFEHSASLSETKLVPQGRSVAETKSIMCTNYMANPNITAAELKEIIALGAADMLDTEVIYNLVNDNQFLRNPHVYRRELAAARKERKTAVTDALGMPGFGQILGRYIDYE